MIPAYSPQARGRSERNFGTWQGRLPQELRLAGCTTLAQANRFLREHYLTEFNRRFRVAAAQRGSAFVPCPQRDLERVFSLQFERTVNRDNTVSFLNLRLQIECRLQRDRAPAPGRNSESQLWTARCGPLRCRWHASGGEGFDTAKQGQGNCPLPLQPHPQNQPGPLGEGTTLKPDISLATKSGHFNLLRTYCHGDSYRGRKNPLPNVGRLARDERLCAGPRAQSLSRSPCAPSVGAYR